MHSFLGPITDVFKSVAKLLYPRKGRNGFCRNFEERRAVLGRRALYFFLSFFSVDFHKYLGTLPRKKKK